MNECLEKPIHQTSDTGPNKHWRSHTQIKIVAALELLWLQSWSLSFLILFGLLHLYLIVAAEGRQKSGEREGGWFAAKGRRLELNLCHSCKDQATGTSRLLSFLKGNTLKFTTIFNSDLHWHKLGRNVRFSLATSSPDKRDGCTTDLRECELASQELLSYYMQAHIKLHVFRD